MGTLSGPIDDVLQMMGREALDGLSDEQVFYA
jgi:hypothetical protein